MKGKNGLQEVLVGIRELLFPESPLCPACQQEPSFRRGLGRHCLSRIVWLKPPFCIKCGRSFHEEYGLCQQCGSVEYFFSMARSVALYDGALREYLTDLKFRYYPELGTALGEILVEWVRLHPDFRQHDLIVPVPIHREKRAVRGYNQAELIARPLGEYLGIPVRDNLLVRTRETQSQSALLKEARFSNLQDAFEMAGSLDITGKRILVVDDIITTGATASEAARTLLESGALIVMVLTLASGLMDDSGPIQA